MENMINNDAVLTNVELQNAADLGVKISDQLDAAASDFSEGVKSVLTPKGVGGVVATTAITAGAIGAGYCAVKLAKKAGAFFTEQFSKVTKVAKETYEQETAKLKSKKETKGAEATDIEVKAESVEEAPKAETPKAETPKAEAPKAEAPKAETPKAEVKPEGGISNPSQIPSDEEVREVMKEAVETALNVAKEKEVA